MAVQTDAFQNFQEYLLERRANDLGQSTKHLNAHVSVLSSEIYLGRFIVKRDLKNLDPSVRTIVEGVRDGKLPQPERNTGYVPPKRQRVKDDAAMKFLRSSLKEADVLRRKAMRKAHQKDIYYPELGILLGIVNLSYEQRGSSHITNSSSSTRIDQEIYFMPSSKTYRAFLMKEYSSDMGLIGLGHHELSCQKIEKIKPETAIERIDLLKTVGLIRRYLSLPAEEIATTDFSEFYRNPSSADENYIISP